MYEILGDVQQKNVAIMSLPHSTCGYVTEEECTSDLNVNDSYRDITGKDLIYQMK